MSTDEFWQIIESSRATTQEEQIELFRGQLQLISAQ